MTAARVAAMWATLSGALGRFGLPGALAMPLLVAAAWLELIANPGLQAQIADVEHRGADARRAAGVVARGERGASIDAAEGFVAAFPAAAERHRRLTNLLALAAGLGLQTQRSDFRTIDEPGLGLSRVRVTLPLVGPYPMLRRFVDQALRDDPALSLDLLRLERGDAAATELRAELQWSLWMRVDAAAAQDAR